MYIKAVIPNAGGLDPVSSHALLAMTLPMIIRVVYDMDNSLETQSKRGTSAKEKDDLTCMS
jgi:hypothetical protein